MMKNDKRTIGNLLEREEPLENPLMIGMIQLTLLGNRSALIENYKGLIEYHDKLIIVQSKEEEVSILEIICGSAIIPGPRCRLPETLKK